MKRMRRVIKKHVNSNKNPRAPSKIICEKLAPAVPFLMGRDRLLIPDFSPEKSAMSEASGRAAKFNQNLAGLAGYPDFATA